MKVEKFNNPFIYFLTVGINHSDWAIKANYVSLLAIWKSIESYAIFLLLESTKWCAYFYRCKFSLTLFKRVIGKVTLS